MKSIFAALFSLIICAIIVPVFFVKTASAQSSTIESAKQFLEFLTQSRYDEATKRFDSKVAAELNGEKLRQVWAALQLQAGTFQRLKDINREIVPTGGQRSEIVILTCEFRTGLVDIRLAHNEVGEISGIFFTPSKSQSVVTTARPAYKLPVYAKLEAIIERPITVKTGSYTLPGTLTLPKGVAKPPVAILIHGSGPNDRDEANGGFKPFKDLALGLAAKGIATIRYDKRTRIYPDSARNAAFTIKDEVIDDALSAIALARNLSDVDARTIVIIGHSLGGMMAPRIAAAAPDVRGVVFLGANARPIQDLLVPQYEFIFSQYQPSEGTRQQLDVVRQQVAKVNSSSLSLQTPAQELPFGMNPAYWIDLKQYDHVATARMLNQPLLVLQADNDYQVTTVDFTLWQRALSEQRGTVFIRYPGLFHLFCPGQMSPVAYEGAGNVAENVIADIATWITMTVATKGK